MRPPCRNIPNSGYVCGDRSLRLGGSRCACSDCTGDRLPSLHIYTSTAVQGNVRSCRCGCLTGSHPALARGLHVATVGADGRRVRGVRRQHRPVPGTEIGITAAGVEGDPAADAIQNLFVAVRVPQP